MTDEQKDIWAKCCKVSEIVDAGKTMGFTRAEMVGYVAGAMYSVFGPDWNSHLGPVRVAAAEIEAHTVTRR